MIKLTDIINEIKVTPPKKFYTINSPNYKSFYQMVKLNDEWGINNWDEDISIDFINGLNDFYFFYFIYTLSNKSLWEPNKCVFTQEELEQGFYDWGIDEDENAQNKVIEKIKEHKV